MQLRTGTTFDRSEYRYDNANDGGITLTASGSTQTIEYRNLEPLLVSTGTADVVFNLTSLVANQAVLENGPNIGEFQLRSTNGTFETTVFAKPTNSLTINGGNLDDVITVNVDASFDISLIINGGNGSADEVNLSSPLTLAAGKSATITAEQTNVNQAIFTPGGFSTSGNTMLAGNVTTTNMTISIGGTLTLASGYVATLSTQGAAGAGDITISGAISGTAGGSDESLTLTAGSGTITLSAAVDLSGDLVINTNGTTAFNGNVSTKSLTTDADGTTAFGAAVTTVTTVDAQIYNDPVTLATGDRTTFAGSAITFNGTVTGATNDLIVNTTGTGATAFNGNVSTKSLTTDADGTTAFGAAVTTVTTVDAQIYNDPVTLATGTTTFAGSAITFNGTVTGATNDLIVNTTGTGAFNGNVSTKSLTTDADGTTAPRLRRRRDHRDDGRRPDLQRPRDAGHRRDHVRRLRDHLQRHGHRRDQRFDREHDRHRHHRLQRQRQHQEPHHRRRRHHRLRHRRDHRDDGRRPDLQRTP